MGGHHGGDDVDDDDDVDVTQPAAGAHPRVGAGPREDAQGPREGLDVGAAAGNGLLPRVERRRVEVAPRHERHLVPGLGELVREGRRVGGDAALVGCVGPTSATLSEAPEEVADGIPTSSVRPPRLVSDTVSTSRRGRRGGRGGDHDAADDEQHGARREVERVPDHVDDGLDQPMTIIQRAGGMSTLSGSKYMTMRSTWRM